MSRPVRWSVWAMAAAVAVVVTAGWNPLFFDKTPRDLLAQGYLKPETGVERLPNGLLIVRAHTRMPEVKAEMVRWWFADYMQTTEHYQRWHPTAHVWMDWENKQPGQIIGASHLVGEYIGEDLHSLRIQFIEPREVLPDYQPSQDQFVLCARVGELDRPINIASMCHIVRNTNYGAEMHSTFWLGRVAKREGNSTVFSAEGLIGNFALTRWLLADKNLATDLMIHAKEEMGYLSDFLPQLYRTET